MRSRRKVRLILVPECRRLILEVPLAGETARAEDTLLGARRLFVPADTGKESIEAMLLDGELQTFGLARSRARGRWQRFIRRFNRWAKFAKNIEAPFRRVAHAAFILLWKLVRSEARRVRK